MTTSALGTHLRFGSNSSNPSGSAGDMHYHASAGFRIHNGSSWVAVVGGTPGAAYMTAGSSKSLTFAYPTAERDRGGTKQYGGNTYTINGKDARLLNTSAWQFYTIVFSDESYSYVSSKSLGLYLYI